MTTVTLERPARLNSVTGGRLQQVPALAAVFILAVLARIVPLLRGGGLSGYGSYDDSVYFASAVGWVHGRWPYRDFLLIQPPGIVVALAPFAALDHWIGDPGGVAVARLAWITMGGLTAAGIALLLWRTSRLAAISAGLFYAFYWPSGMVERVTDLEGPQNFLLVLALLLLRPFGPARSRSQRTAAVIAGVALGLALSIKIWEVVPIVVLAGWLALKPRTRKPGWFLAGVAAGVTAICLPFFVTAPQRMWTMVVADQLGRPWHRGWAKRLVYTTGTSHLLRTSRVTLALIAVLLLILIILALSLRRPAARLFVVLYAATVIVLLKSPPTYVHYGSFPATELAVLFGIAIAEAVTLARRIRFAAVARAGSVAVVGFAAALLLVLAYSPATAHDENPVPTGKLATIAAGLPGCITYDEPSEALSLNLVSRDLNRHCPFIVDLGAVSRWTRLSPSGHHNSAAGDAVALHYLRSGSATLLYRYLPGKGHKGAVHILGHWRLLAREHGLRLVQPVEGPSGA